MNPRKYQIETSEDQNSLGGLASPGVQGTSTRSIGCTGKASEDSTSKGHFEQHHRQAEFSWSTDGWIEVDGEEIERKDEWKCNLALSLPSVGKVMLSSNQAGTIRQSSFCSKTQGQGQGKRESLRKTPSRGTREDQGEMNFF
jgi:hypothetical protein